MKKSAFSQTLDQVQKELTPSLQQSGFRKRGRNYNRLVSDGIVHVINFQMGQYPIGDSEIPGIRENLYGSFTVNFGVLIPCVEEIEFRRKPKQFYFERDCHIRTRLGSLINHGSDMWWELTQDVALLTAIMEDLIPKFGVPFFENFPDYQAITEYNREHANLPFNSSGRSALIIGIIHHVLGDDQESEKHFDKALEFAHKEISHPGFQNHIQEVRKRCLLPPAPR